MCIYRKKGVGKEKNVAGEVNRAGMQWIIWGWEIRVESDSSDLLSNYEIKREEKMVSPTPQSA